MTDAKLPVLKVAVARCEAAFTALAYSDVADRVVINPPDGQAYPYAVVGDAHQRLSGEATDSTGDASEVNTIIRVYHTNPIAVMQLAAEIISRMTDRSSPPTPEGWDLYMFDLVSDMQVDDPRRPDAPDVYGWALTFKLVLEPTS